MENQAQTNAEPISDGRTSDGGARPYKRRRVVVNRAFQFRYAMIILALFGLAAFMVWWETYESLRGLTEAGLIQDPQLLSLLSKINHVVFVKVGIALGMVWGLSVLLSHYLAGPLYRIEATL